MWNIIWKWRFPDKVIRNDKKIVSTDFSENVVCIPTQLNMENTAKNELMDFKDAIIRVIDAIIDEWIDDYLTFKWEKIESEEEVDIEKRNLLKETTEIWDEMLIKALAIEDTVDFIWSDYQVWIDFKPEYILWAIEWLLNTYRNRVFEKLIRNEKKLKNNN